MECYTIATDFYDFLVTIIDGVHKYYLLEGKRIQLFQLTLSDQSKKLKTRPQGYMRNFYNKFIKISYASPVQ